MNLKAHLEASMEEHLTKTWSKHLTTTARLTDRLEEVELDKEYIQRLLHRNCGKISDMRLEWENMGFRHHIKRLRHDINGLQKDMAELRRLHIRTNNQDEIDALRPTKSPANKYVHDNFFNTGHFVATQEANSFINCHLVDALS